MLRKGTYIICGANAAIRSKQHTERIQQLTGVYPGHFARIIMQYLQEGGSSRLGTVSVRYQHVTDE